MTEEEAYHEMTAYTLSLRDPEFIHQHVVDAYTAQNADETTKPIAITFALVGLFMHVEKHISGKDVQRAHMQLALDKRTWPKMTLPKRRGSMTALDVIASPAGPARNRAIDEWCESVWKEFAASNRDRVAALLDDSGVSTERK